jgi:peptide/nickel transport system permease protein
MKSYLVQRALFSAISLLGLLVAVFLLSRLTGDPASLMLPIDATLEQHDAFAAAHGLNDPVLLQFGRYLWQLVHLDFGTSLRQNRPAMELALRAFPVTLLLAGLAISIASACAVVVGALAAVRPFGVFDRLASAASLVLASAPGFWIAIVGVMVFAVALHWLPTSGTGSAVHWILPVAVVAVRPFGLLVQVVRGAMITTLSAPFIKTARVKGLPARRIIFVHALRNSMLPVIAVAGDLTTGLVNGAVVAETIFGLPGIGSLMLKAILERDFAVVQAAILVTAVAIFLLNLLIDLAYVLLDPRIRFQ